MGMSNQLTIYLFMECNFYRSIWHLHIFSSCWFMQFILMILVFTRYNSVVHTCWGRRPVSIFRLSRWHSIWKECNSRCL